MKKSEKQELLRIQNVIENDRLNIGDGFNELLLSDLEKLLIDFFDLSGDISLNILKGKGKYKVEITFDTTRLKSFNCLPKQ